MVKKGDKGGKTTTHVGESNSEVNVVKSKDFESISRNEYKR